ncbi:MAG: type II toxin-antitoxin system VapC family toxin [Methanocellales archaeon]|nr:type II toxin-antitoxin system VapC family toxin [Methanocellales archaeon]
MATDPDRKLIDVNALSIFLVEDHPGYGYVFPKMMSGLRGEYVLLIFDYLPIRANWILTAKWKCDPKESVKAIKDFLRYTKPKYVSASRETLKKAYELSEKLDHDVYDCFYLALALQENATHILTTDKDFKKLCPQINLGYENPVPDDVLKRFVRFSLTSL